MRDAAGELAHRLHLLRLAELLLAPAERLLRGPLLGDVLIEDDRAYDLVRRRRGSGTAELRIDPLRPVEALDPDQLVERGLAVEQRAGGRPFVRRDRPAGIGPPALELAEAVDADVPRAAPELPARAIAEDDPPDRPR